MTMCAHRCSDQPRKGALPLVVPLLFAAATGFAAEPVEPVKEQFEIRELVPTHQDPGARTSVRSLNRIGDAAGSSTTTGQSAQFPIGTIWSTPSVRGIVREGSALVAVGNQGRTWTAPLAATPWTLVGGVDSPERRFYAVSPDSDGVGLEPRLVVGTRAGIYRNAERTPADILWTTAPLRDEVAPTLFAVDQRLRYAGQPDQEYAAVAVGERGTILTSLNYGSQWTQQLAPIEDLRGVAVLSVDVQIATGDRGTVLVRNTSASNRDPDDDGSEWNRLDLGTDADLLAVACAERGDGAIAIAIGAADGRIWTLIAPAGIDGTITVGGAIPEALGSVNWTVSELPPSDATAPSQWNAVDLAWNGTNLVGVAVGARGGVAAWNGSAWVRSPVVNGSTSLRSVAIIDPASGDAAAVSGDGRVYRRTGGSWSAVSPAIPGGTPESIGTTVGGLRSEIASINADGRIVGAGHKDAGQTIAGLTRGVPRSTEEHGWVVLQDQEIHGAYVRVQSGSGNRVEDDPATAANEMYEFDHRERYGLLGRGRVLEFIGLPGASGFTDPNLASLRAQPNIGSIRQIVDRPAPGILRLSGDGLPDAVSVSVDLRGLPDVSGGLRRRATLSDTAEEMELALTPVVISGANTFWVRSATNADDAYGTLDDTDPGSLVWVADSVGPDGNNNNFAPFWDTRPGNYGGGVPPPGATDAFIVTEVDAFYRTFTVDGDHRPVRDTFFERVMIFEPGVSATVSTAMVEDLNGQGLLLDRNGPGVPGPWRIVLETSTTDLTGAGFTTPDVNWIPISATAYRADFEDDPAPQFIQFRNNITFPTLDNLGNPVNEDLFEPANGSRWFRVIGLTNGIPASGTAPAVPASLVVDNVGFFNGAGMGTTFNTYPNSTTVAASVEIRGYTLHWAGTTGYQPPQAPLTSIGGVSQASMVFPIGTPLGSFYVGDVVVVSGTASQDVEGAVPPVPNGGKRFWVGNRASLSIVGDDPAIPFRDNLLFLQAEDAANDANSYKAGLRRNGAIIDEWLTMRIPIDGVFGPYPPGSGVPAGRHAITLGRQANVNFSRRILGPLEFVRDPISFTATQADVRFRITRPDTRDQQVDLTTVLGPNATARTEEIRGPFAVDVIPGRTEIELSGPTNPAAIVVLPPATESRPNPERVRVGVPFTTVVPNPVAGGVALTPLDARIDAAWLVPGMLVRIHGGGPNDGRIVTIASVQLPGVTAGVRDPDQAADEAASGTITFLEPMRNPEPVAVGQTTATPFGYLVPVDALVTASTFVLSQDLLRVTFPAGVDPARVVGVGDLVVLGGNVDATNLLPVQDIALGTSATRWRVVSITPENGGSPAQVQVQRADLGGGTAVSTGPEFMSVVASRLFAPDLPQVVESELVAINDDGVAVGTQTQADPTDPSPDGVQRAVILKPGDAPQAIEPLGGGDQGLARAISNRKQRFRTRHIQNEEIVGSAANPTGLQRAFVFRPSHMNGSAQVVENTVVFEGQPPGYPVGNRWSMWLFRTGGAVGKQTQAQRIWNWYCGANGSIYTSTDDSAPVAQNSGTTNDLFDIDFFDPQVGVAVGEGGTLLFTTDGGSTWARAARDDGSAGPVTTADLYAVHFVKGGPRVPDTGWTFRATQPQIVFACGAGGTIIKSVDGGATWRKQETGVTADLYDISFPGDGYIPWTRRQDAVRGWAVGDQVLIFTNSSGEAPSSGGGTGTLGWKAADFPAEYRRRIFWTVDYFTADRAYIAGEGGMVLMARLANLSATDWSAFEIGRLGRDIYSIDVAQNNYESNNGADPQPGAVRTLPAPPGAVISPRLGEWAAWGLNVYPPPNNDLPPPMIVAVGAEGGIWYSTHEMSGNWRAASLPIEGDLRAVSLNLFDIRFDSTDAGTARDNIRVSGALVEGYRSVESIIAGTDGRMLKATWSNDPVRGLSTNMSDFDNLTTVGFADVPPANPKALPTPNIGSGGQVPPISGALMGGRAGAPWSWSEIGRAAPADRDLGSMSTGGISEARDIDDNGYIVGVARASIGSQPRAFLLRKRTGAFAYDPMLDLGTLGGRSAQANAISRVFGIIVGTSTRYFGSEERPRAFIWQAGRMRDLNDLVDPVYAADPARRWVLTNATDVNEYGEVVGQGFLDADGDGVRDVGEEERGFIVHPLSSVANAAPTAVIVHPSGGEAFSASVDNPATLINPDQPQRIRIGVLATDPDGTIAKVEFYIGNTLVGAATSTTQGGGGGGAGYFEITWTAPIDIPIAQSESITAVVTDNLGRRSVSAPITITIVPSGQQVVVQDLGTLGGDSSEAMAVNNRGTVVGRAQTSRGSFHAFSWDGATGMRDLGVIANDADTSEAFDVNDQGLITGRSRYTDDPASAVAVRWRNGVLGVVPGALSGTTPSVARSVSSLDQIVGSGPTSYGAQLGWLWRSATEGTVPLPTLGGFSAEAYAINTYRRITGRAQDSEGDYQAFLWDRGFPYGSIQSITSVRSGVVTSEGRGINYSGDIVGMMQIAAGFRGFLWRAAGTVTTLNPIGSDVRSEAFSVNDGTFSSADIQFKVAGRSVSSTGTSRAALWFNDASVLDLAAELPAGTGFTSLSEARDVNNSGMVVGTGINGGKRRAFALRLVETPTRVINTPPTVVMTTPVDGQRVTSVNSLTLSAIAADGDGTVRKVDFWLGGTTTNDNLLIGSVEQATTIDGVSYYSFTWNSVQAGEYYIVAVATDDSGATSTSERVRINVVRPENNAAPAIAITRVGSATAANGIARVTDVGTLTISGTAADDAALARIDLYLIDGTNQPVLQGTRTVSGTASAWSIPLLTELVDGTYTVVAVVAESAQGGQTAQVTVSQPVVFYLSELVTNPVPAPVIRITTPSVDSVFNAGNSIALGATVDQGDVTAVTFYAAPLWASTTELVDTGNRQGFVLLGTDDIVIDGFTYSWVGAEPGIYAVYALATDATGRRGISARRIVEVRHRILRIESEADGELAVPEGATFSYVVRAWVKDANGVSQVQPSDRLRISIQDPDPADGVDLVGTVQMPLAGAEELLLQRTIRWVATPPSSGAHVRIRIRAVLDNGDADATNDPVDVQDIVVFVQPAAVSGG